MLGGPISRRFPPTQDLVDLIQRLERILKSVPGKRVKYHSSQKNFRIRNPNSRASIWKTKLVNYVDQIWQHLDSFGWSYCYRANFTPHESCSMWCSVIRGFVSSMWQQFLCTERCKRSFIRDAKKHSCIVFLRTT
ncbi:hypothetical protein NPIL_628951 [Nephila pilipes]|uniref:Uncharacterized protein n=1 Tax=Nephila pilipes TaxID=299642 RepID=A0A8X6QHB5_NEPPI|nr:hypothetical protein NPIL_628951 [Nephila pilipes]